MKAELRLDFCLLEINEATIKTYRGITHSKEADKQIWTFSRPSCRQTIIPRLYHPPGPLQAQSQNPQATHEQIAIPQNVI